MNRDFDIEDILKRYDCEPGENTKRSVLDRFRQTHPVDAPGRDSRGFWRKPVPVYVAAAALMVLAGFAFLAGRQSARSEAPPGLSGKATDERAVVTPEAIEWVAAENDLL